MSLPELKFFETQLIDSVFKAIQKAVIFYGYMPDPDLYPGNDVLTAQVYQQAIDEIKAEKGFEIKVFNQSSARRKAAKKSPRIVIFKSRDFQGSIGAPVHEVLQKSHGGNYVSGFLPQMTSSIVLAVHLLTAESQEFSVVNQILQNCIGKRNYLNYYDRESNTYLERKFFIEQTSFNDLDDPLEGVSDKAYFFTIPDVYLGDIRDVSTVAAIKYIGVKIDDEPKAIEAGIQPL